jgi:1-deoxy-D-xylulose-5-phosphate synthase
MRVVREGSDVALLAIGKMVPVAEEAAALLISSGIRATVVDARFVKPLDSAIAPLAARHRAVLTIEDGTISGGFGSAVLELLGESDISVPVRLLGLPDSFIEHGGQADLLSQHGLDAPAVAAAALALLKQPAELAG